METEEDDLFFLSFQSGLSSPNPSLDLVIFILAQTPIFFYWEYSFSDKGITLFALDCEATYISITPKIPK